MSGASLCRALVHAGAPEGKAKEAADNMDNTIKAIDGRLSGLEIMVAEIRVTNRILIALLIAVLIKSFF